MEPCPVLSGLGLHYPTFGFSGAKTIHQREILQEHLTPTYGVDTGHLLQLWITDGGEVGSQVGTAFFSIRGWAGPRPGAGGDRRQ